MNYLQRRENIERLERELEYAKYIDNTQRYEMESARLRAAIANQREILKSEDLFS